MDTLMPSKFMLTFIVSSFTASGMTIAALLADQPILALGLASVAFAALGSSFLMPMILPEAET